MKRSSKGIVTTDGVEEIAVNGVSVAAPSEGYGTFAVLPGTYSVDLSSAMWLILEP